LVAPSSKEFWLRKGQEKVPLKAVDQAGKEDLIVSSWACQPEYIGNYSQLDKSGGYLI